MSVKNEEDKAPKFDQVDRTKGDAHGNLKNANSNDDFKYEPTKQPHNKAVDGKPLDTSKDQYNEATRVGNDEGQEAIKTSREKFAKKKDEPSGIASAKVGSDSIKSSLSQTDPQRTSQVLPQMYDMFAMVSGILNASSSGQQGQSQAQIQAGQPDFYQDLDSHTKDLLISAITHGLAILTRNFGYDKVIDNMIKATTGFYTLEELNAIDWVDTEFDPATFRFDRLNPDYQDVVVTSLTLLAQLFQKYGQSNIPFIQPFYKPKTLKTPPKIVTTPTSYSILKFYPESELKTISFNGNTDIGKNGFINIANNTLVNNDIVIYNPDTGNTVINGLVSNSYYLVVEANTSGFKLAVSAAGSPLIIKESTTSSALNSTILISGAPKVINGINITAIIVDKYKKLLKRAPDQTGLIYWENLFQGYLQTDTLTTALAILDDAFKGSDEYKELTSSSTTTIDATNTVPVYYVGSDGITRDLSYIVRDKYNTFLKRTPDKDGLNFWIKTLQGYLDTYSFHDAIMKVDSDFKSSVEYKKLNNIAVDKVELKPVTTKDVIFVDTSGENYNLSAILRDKYNTYLKRVPDQDGQTFFEGVLKLYIQQYGFNNAMFKINEDFKNSQEYKNLQKSQKPKTVSTSNTNISPKTTVANTTPVKILSSKNANAVLTILEEYPGYARWDKTDGSIEYMLRTQYLPDFENVDLLVVYLSAYSFAHDLFGVIPKTALDNNLLNILLDRYTRKIENDYTDYVLGWSVSADRMASAEDFNQFPETGGSGNKSSMLQQLLPQLQQLMQQTKQTHLPSSVLEQEKMRKLLENFEQKKIENKRMANFADDGIGGDGIAGVGNMFQNGNISSLLGQFKSVKGGGTGGAGSASAGTVTTSTANGTTTTTVTTATAQTGIVTLTTLIGGTTDGSSVVRTFATTQPVTTLSATEPPAAVYTKVGGTNINITQVVRDKYQTYFKRQPDTEGWNFWISQFQNYLTQYSYHDAIMKIDADFKSSSEFRKKSANTAGSNTSVSNTNPVTVIPPITTADVIYKNYNISAMIKDKYKAMMGRQVDQEGLTYWEGIVKGLIDQYGYDQAVFKFMDYIKNSEEYKQKKALAKVNTKTLPRPEIKTDNLVGFKGKL